METLCPPAAGGSSFANPHAEKRREPAELLQTGARTGAAKREEPIAVGFDCLQEMRLKVILEGDLHLQEMRSGRILGEGLGANGIWIKDDVEDFVDENDRLCRKRVGVFEGDIARVLLEPLLAVFSSRPPASYLLAEGVFDLYLTVGDDSFGQRDTTSAADVLVKYSTTRKSPSPRSAL